MNIVIAEQSSDPALQARHAVTAISCAAELLARRVGPHAATCGQVMGFMQWCAQNESNRLGCLALARMVRDELAMLSAVVRGDACALLATAQQQTERLIGVLSDAVEEAQR